MTRFHFHYISGFPWESLNRMLRFKQFVASQLVTGFWSILPRVCSKSFLLLSSLLDIDWGLIVVANATLAPSISCVVHRQILCCYSLPHLQQRTYAEEEEAWPSTDQVKRRKEEKKDWKRNQTSRKVYSNFEANWRISTAFVHTRPKRVSLQRISMWWTFHNLSTTTLAQDSEFKHYNLQCFLFF